MQIVTHGIALVLGAVAGIVGAHVAEYMANPDVLSRPEGDLSRAELIAKLDEAQKKYADLLAESQKRDAENKTEVETAQQKVVTLETKVSEKEKEVEVLQLKVKKGQNKSAALKKELEEKQAELDGLRVELEAARAQVVQLQADLDVSRHETVSAREETQVARGETIEARWEGFKSDAMVQICEKGNRNRLGKCRDEVVAALDTRRAQSFRHCLASKQATPRLVRVDDKVKDPELPRWSEWVNEEGKFTGDKWYIVFCDPTLPEATGIEEDAATPAPEPIP